MMQSKTQITRENAVELLLGFAKKCRKATKITPAEIVMVGGGSIMLNYKFRDSTQDFDAILVASSAVKDAIRLYAEEQNLAPDWMNCDFMKTTSYSSKLSAVSEYFCSFNNGNLVIRTVTGKYLIAMKIRAHREYRNDISDVIGIIIEERELSNNISFKDISEAYCELYEESLDEQWLIFLNDIIAKDTQELKDLFDKRLLTEKFVNTKVITYIDDDFKVSEDNVDDVTRRIREKLNQMR